MTWETVLAVAWGGLAGVNVATAVTTQGVFARYGACATAGVAIVLAIVYLLTWVLTVTEEDA